MTDLHENVTLGFRGRQRTLPLASIALVLRRDLHAAARALEILIDGPSRYRPTPAEDARSSHHDDRGEGVGGGAYPERSERRGPRSDADVPEQVEERSERERSDVGASEDELDDDALARSIAVDLADIEHLHVIRALVARHPRALIGQALRAAVAVPADRIRSSRGAIFTGIVRKLSAEAAHSRAEPTS